MHSLTMLTFIYNLVLIIFEMVFNSIIVLNIFELKI